MAERWIGIFKVRATALLADVRLPPEYWSHACRWVAYVHTYCVTKIAINKPLPDFGDVEVVHQAFKKPPSFENRGVTGVCLAHDSRIAGGVLVVSVVNGDLKARRWDKHGGYASTPNSCDRKNYCGDTPCGIHPFSEFPKFVSFRARSLRKGVLLPS